jgi:hypothetical protein
MSEIIKTDVFDQMQKEKVVLKPLKIKSISLMEGVYEDVEYAGTMQDFIHNVSNEKLINIYEDGKSIWLNTDYIMSFEI